MTEPELRTESLFRLTWPIYLQQITQSLVLLADFWFFSRLSDTVAATVGQLLPVVWIGTFVIPVFAGTGVSVASQYMGAKQWDKVVPAYMTNLLLTVGMGGAFALALWWFAGDIGRWMGMDPALNAIGRTYLGAFSGYFVFLGILVGYSAVLSSRGLTHWLMYGTLLVASLNISLEALFVFGLHWGVRGIASASVISVAVAAGLIVWLVHGRLGVRFTLKGASRDVPAVLRPILKIGVSNALEPLSYSVQQIILSTMIIALGVRSMAANNYAARPQMFQITFSVALALGSQILMGHWMGAGRFEDVNRLYWKAIRRATAVAFACALALWILSNTVLGVFTTDPAIIRLGGTLLLIAVFYEPARAVNIVTGFGLKSVGDARFPMVVGILFIWGILPVVFLVNHFRPMSLAGFWLFFAADEIVRACVNMGRWRTGRWRTKGIARVDAGDAASATVSSGSLLTQP